MTNKNKILRIVIALVGIASLIGFAYETSALAGVYLFLMLWSNNCSNGD